MTHDRVILVHLIFHFSSYRVSAVYSVMQSDGNNLKIDTFLRDYNFLTKDHILILKTPT